MGFFVEGSRRNGDAIQEPSPDRIDLEWIVLGKKAGLSLAEINEFRVRDLAAYVEIFAGVELERPRAATQEDIDRFYVA